MALAVGGSGPFGIEPLLLVGGLASGLTLGFGLGLTALRRFLYPDAAVDKRRSLLAGLCSPLYLGLVSIFTQGATLTEVAGFSVLTGAAVGLALFFPWLSRTPTQEDRDREFRETLEAELEASVELTQ